MEESSSVPNLRKLKTNGFNCPLHWMQVVSWLGTLAYVILFYSMVLPSFDLAVMIGLDIICGINLLILFIITMIATGLNPTDPIVLNNRNALLGR